MLRFISLLVVVFVVQLVFSVPVGPKVDKDEEPLSVPIREDLFEGDIAGVDVDSLKTPDGMASFRNGILSSSRRWPDGKVPYTVAAGFSAAHRAVVNGAIAEINRQTNVVLTPRKTETNYIHIRNGAQSTGCYSYVGQTGGMQVVNLEPQTPTTGGCVYHGIVIHELTHAIGFYHEQSRTDRDQYVEMNWSNIQQSNHNQFNKYESNQITAFKQAYDYGSVMHYGKYAFAIDRNVWTIRPKAPNQSKPIGQRTGLSAVDITKINSMYPKKRSTVLQQVEAGQ
ncbi:hypothetical protein RvY_16274 [Ramazzottius varieornatus]|uniref:Metalloendopeptidase n=1 Tax=Ramazzottius varieornatus TaxID=947166 RepID=A0A1D1VXV3_RAMVA|nr:hypothetical protein RvY_16274 [Ramazzottius varieornatus]